MFPTVIQKAWLAHTEGRWGTLGYTLGDGSPVDISLGFATVLLHVVTWPAHLENVLSEVIRIDGQDCLVRLDHL